MKENTWKATADTAENHVRLHIARPSSPPSLVQQKQ